MIKAQTNIPYSTSNIITVSAGVIGFIIAVYFLYGFSASGKQRFHEIRFDPKIQTGQYLLSVRIQDSSRLAHLIPLAGKPPDSATIRDTLKIRLARITDLLYQWQYGNKDTTFDRHIYYSLNRAGLYNSLTNFKDSNRLTVGYFDRLISPEIWTAPVPITRKSYACTADFFSKYPAFALWIFIGIAQMIIWFLVIPICFFIYNMVQSDMAKHFYVNTNWWISLAMAFVSVGIFCWLVYRFVIDKLIITDIYFMDGFISRLTSYSFFGYLVAALSFTGYLFIASEIYALQKKYETSDDVGKLNVQTTFVTAKKYFSIYFYITATILSIVVLWIGSLFSAINSMDVMRYYRYISGVSFLPNDFVYLFGGLHSLLLLIFFLPVQLNMFNLSSAIPALGANQNSDNSWSTLLKNLGQNFGNLIIVSSPILASLLHGLISSVTNT
jgi:hypothetical protein